MKKVVIIGGGISGLYIANLFQQNSNYEIIVYEKMFVKVWLIRRRNEEETLEA